MINVNMTDKAGVTLATAGKYCADNVKVTPLADILRKDEQAKTATPTTSAQDITPDAGKALSKVTVNPITAAIVGNLDASSFAASIVAAIEGKGVTVPDGTLLDGMASLIESIQTGGGSATSITGTITLDGRWSNVNLLTYEELTNVFGQPLPTLFVAIYRTTPQSGMHTGGCFWVSNQENAVYLYRNYSDSGFAKAASLHTYLPTITQTGGLVIPGYTTYNYLSGEHYYSVSRYDG